MLYIMRHGITEWNELHKMQGRTDIPLNDKGKLMAENACKKYKDVNFDVCYCSPLVRASETAHIVCKNRNIPIIEDDRLVEMSFGKFEGTANSLQIPDCPINVLFNNPANYVDAVGEAETFDELFTRTGEFIKEIIEPQLQMGKDILIVGHGAMNASIICQIKNIPIEQFWNSGLEHCKLMVL